MGRCATRIAVAVACLIGGAGRARADERTLETARIDAGNGLSGLLGLARGNRPTCAIQSDRSVACWGSNSFGQLGDGVKATQNPVTARTSCP